MTGSLMRLSALPICLFLLTGAAALHGEEKKSDAPDDQRIRGAWRVVSAKDEGREKPHAIGNLYLFDTAKLHVISPRGERTVYRYEVDATATPKRLVLLTDDELFTQTAVYKIEGDKLTFCSSYQPGVIPAEFATKLRDGCTLLVLKRETHR